MIQSDHVHLLRELVRRRHLVIDAQRGRSRRQLRIDAPRNSRWRWRTWRRALPLTCERRWLLLRESLRQDDAAGLRAQTDY